MCEACGAEFPPGFSCLEFATSTRACRMGHNKCVIKKHKKKKGGVAKRGHKPPSRTHVRKPANHVELYDRELLTPAGLKSAAPKTYRRIVETQKKLVIEHSSSCGLGVYVRPGCLIRAHEPLMVFAGELVMASALQATARRLGEAKSEVVHASRAAAVEVADPSAVSTVYTNFRLSYACPLTFAGNVLVDPFGAVMDFRRESGFDAISVCCSERTTHLAGLFNHSTRPNARIERACERMPEFVGVLGERVRVPCVCAASDVDNRRGKTPLELTIRYGCRGAAHVCTSSPPPWVVYDVRPEEALRWDDAEDGAEDDAEDAAR